MTNLLTLSPIEQARRAELERLTGCPIHHVIEGTCHEAGCQNAALQMQKDFVFSEDMCQRLREVALEEVAPPKAPADLLRDTLPAYPKDAAPIFQTKPRLRCVL